MPRLSRSMRALITVTLGLSACTADPSVPTVTPSANPPATTAAAAVDLKAELSTFITQRAISQGKETGALLLTSAIKSVDRKGTEWTVLAEFDSLLLVAEAPKQLAYLIGVYDPRATKVTVKTPGGQELFAGAPPKQPVSGTSPTP